MKTPAIGRNDPCPCGSGKKFKQCCMGKTAEMSEGLQEAMEGRQFNSLAEAQAFTDRYTQQRNQRPLDEFHGVSPEQMHRILHFPFTSPEWVGFAEVLSTAPTAPILSLFDLLVEAIGERGIEVSYESIRQWCNRFGPKYARNLTKRRGRLDDTWYLDEVFVAI